MGNHISDSEFLVQMQRLPAGFLKRAGALIIDFYLVYLFSNIILGVITFGLEFLLKIDLPFISYASFFHNIVTLWYFTIFHAEKNQGQTFGKLAVGIQVVDKNGRYLSRIQSFKRAITKLFLSMVAGFASFGFTELYPGMMAIIGTGIGISYLYTMLFNNQNEQTIHDLVIGSYVIKKHELDHVEMPKIQKKHRFYVVNVPLVGVTIGMIGVILGLLFNIN